MAFAFDAALSAFLREMGVAEQDIYAQARQQSNIAENAFNRTLPVYAEQRRQAIQQINNDAETRGVYQSGATARQANIASANIYRQQEEARAQLQDQQSSYAFDAARQIAELRRQQLEQEFQARLRSADALGAATYGG